LFYYYHKFIYSTFHTYHLKLANILFFKKHLKAISLMPKLKYISQEPKIANTH